MLPLITIGVHEGLPVGVGVGLAPPPLSARISQLPISPLLSMVETGISLSFRFMMLPPPGVLEPATQLVLGKVGGVSSKADGNWPATWVMTQPAVWPTANSAVPSSIM